MIALHPLTAELTQPLYSELPGSGLRDAEREPADPMVRELVTQLPSGSMRPPSLYDGEGLTSE